MLDRALRVREGGRIGMVQLGAVAELAGLGSRRAAMPPERISNDELPAIVRCRGALAVAHARHGEILRVASPKLGRLEIDPVEMDVDAEGNTELLEVAVEKQRSGGASISRGSFQRWRRTSAR